MPGGYCTTDCAAVSCPGGSTCFDIRDGSRSVCFLDCSRDDQCRTDEGYYCDEYDTCYIDSACFGLCDDKSCGDDGCGGSCGECATGFVCGEAGVCEEAAETCARLRSLRSFASEPSAIAFLFVAEDCRTGVPLDGLDGADFVVEENGVALSSEAYRDVLDGRGYRVVTELLLDFSNSTVGIRQQLVDGAKRFARELLVDRDLGERVKIGLTLFDGSAELYRLQLPTSDVDALEAALDALLTYEPIDGGATNLYGAVLQGLADLQERTRALAKKNLDGVVATGHLVIFTDGKDTADRVPAATARQAINDARDVNLAGPSGVIQTWAIALAGQDYDPLALQDMLGDQRAMFVAQSSAALEGAFDALGQRIGAEVESTYLFVYCSAKREGQHEVSLTMSPIAVDSSESLAFAFDASSFAGGCSAAFFSNACDDKECGGFACGACDDEVAACHPVTLACDDYCVERDVCAAEEIINDSGYEQSCVPSGSSCNARPYVQLSAGDDHTCGLTEQGKVYCWGLNNYLQVGSGAANPQLTPFEMAGISDARQIVTGTRYTCVLLGDGTVWCWGGNSGTPVQVSNLTNVSMLDAHPVTPAPCALEWCPAGAPDRTVARLRWQSSPVGYFSERRQRHLQRRRRGGRGRLP